MDAESQIALLVIEPDSMFRKALTRTLRLEQYSVSEATTFEQLVHQLETGTFQLIITDVHIPHVDGITLLRWLHQNAPDVPIIVLTRSATVSTAIEAVKLGVADYLLKPLSAKTVLETIVQVLGKKSEQAQREQLAQSVFAAMASAGISKSTQTEASSAPTLLHAAPLTLDATAHLLYADDDRSNPILLSARETALLEAMMRHPNDILTFQNLACAIGIDDFTGPSFNQARRNIRMYISRLRKKIETQLHHRNIYTVRNTGYLYRPNSSYDLEKELS